MLVLVGHFKLTFYASAFQIFLLALLNCAADFPLHDDGEGDLNSVPGNRDPSKCVFGTEEFSVGHVWHPTLEIFNRPTYMPCVTCTCYQAEMFGYYFYESDLLPKVSCEQIGDKCPPLDCEYPISDPKKCCKYCPEEDKKDSFINPFSKEDSSKKGMLRDGDDEKNEKENPQEVENKFLSLEEDFNYFTAILSGNNFWPRRQTGAVSRIYLEYIPESQTVHISIIHKQMSGRPTFLEVTDPNNPDQALFTHKIDHVVDLAPGRRICVTWKDVEFKIMEKMSSNLLFATLKTEVYPDGEVKGVITKHRALLRESFGALLSPISDPGMSTGGFVFASLHHGSKTSLDIIVALQGLSDYFLQDTALEVRLYDSTDGLIGQFSDTINPVTSQSWAEQAVTWSISGESELVRGLLKVKVLVGDKGTQQLSLVGSLQPKKTCGSYHCVLSQGTPSRHIPKGASGSTLVTFESNFDLSYQIHTSGLKDYVNQVAFVAGIDKESEFDLKLDVSYTYFDQWAVGFVTTPSVELIQSLMIGELYLQISTSLDTYALYGKLEPLHYSKHFSNKNIPPLLLSGKAMLPRIETRASGNARVHLDDRCRLQFEVFTDGFEKDARLSLQIGQLLSEKLLKPVWSENFSSGTISGSVDELSEEFLDYLNVGQVYMQVGSKNHPEGEIRTKVSISNSCKPKSSEGHLSSAMMGDSGSYDSKDKEEEKRNSKSEQERLAGDSSSCFFEGQFYADLQQWNPQFDKTCTSCHCANRAVICEGRYQCEVPTCENPIIPEGECCFKCPENDFNSVQNQNPTPEDATCKHNGVIYAVGETWNPTVHPFGVIKCAECVCLGKNDVSCNRIECPKTECSHPVKKNPTDCCAVCIEEGEDEKPSPPKSFEGSEDLENSMQADGGFKASMKKNGKPCQLGDFLYSNGEVFHPIVPPFGEQWCVDCLCTDGKTTCSRTTCDPIDNCPPQFIRTFPDQCCPKCMSLQIDGDKTSYADFVLGS